MISKEREKVLKLLYKKGFNVDVKKVPSSYIDFYKHIPYKILIRPLVIDEYLTKKKSLTQLAIRYSTTKGVIRNILRYVK